MNTNRVFQGEHKKEPLGYGVLHTRFYVISCVYYIFKIIKNKSSREPTMSKIIILDTNILIQKKELKYVKALIEQYKKMGDVYITETVLDEFTNYNYKIMETELIVTLEKYPFMYKLLDIDYNIENIHSKKPFIELKYIIRKLFDDKIISMDTVELQKVYRRAIRKIAPFDSSKNSDKGFKDTLIWLSILDYDYTNYSEVFFITEDNVFKNHENFFKEEFDEKHNKPISVYKALLSENVSEVEKKLEESEASKLEKDIDINSEEILEDYHKINDFRNDLEQALNEIIFFTEREYDHIECRFNIQKYVDIINLEIFRIHLNKLVKENMFSVTISASVFLAPYIDKDDIKEIQQIEIKSIVKLSRIIGDFQKILPKYTSAFLSEINHRINIETYLTSLYPNNPFEISDDDLPF